MSKTIEIVSHGDCTGCGACLNICPKDAISMEVDGDFAFPVIDHDACIECGLCERSCPALHPSYANAEKPDCYAYWADDEVREVSSSGGAFTVLAEGIIARGGVVAGAAYSDDCYSVEYRTVERSEDLAPLRGSKYVQADTGYVYRDVKRALDEGRPALFVGCPCEVAGMKAFLGKDDPNLYLVDLVCHGVPPQSLYEKFIREEEDKHNSKAVRVSFRDKTFAGWNPSTVIDFENGESYLKRRNECPYMRAFLDRIMFRESCGHCLFATLPRQGDLTIADFWDIHRFDQSFDDRKGTSLLLVNNDRGGELLRMLRADAKLLEPAPLDHGIRYNSQIKYSSIHNEKRKRFQELMHRYGYTFEKAANYALRERYDVGFVGWWYGANYGSTLTSFALNRVLVEMGKSVLMLNWPMNPPSEPGARGYRFGKHFYNIAKYRPLDQTHDFNNYCDTFVVGSDQLWNWWSNRDTGSYYFFLDWADDEHKKIAYSTSFGHDSVYYPEEMRLKLCYLLSRFDSISVRENSAVEVCRHDFGVDATQTMDPVFLCSMENYDEAIALSELTYDGPYVLGYIMNPTPDKRDAIRRVSDELGLPYKILVDGQADFDELRAELGDSNIHAGVETQDWLFLFKNASYIVTDSFHGFCFSLIFHKQVSVFINLLRGKARIDTLSAIAGIEDRVFERYDEFSRAENWAHPIDYAAVAARLDPEIERSRQWLAHALEAQKRQPSAAEMLYRKLSDTEKKLSVAESRLDQLQAEQDELRRELRGNPAFRAGDLAKRGHIAVRDRGVTYALRRFVEKLKARATRS